MNYIIGQDMDYVIVTAWPDNPCVVLYTSKAHWMARDRVLKASPFKLAVSELRSRQQLWGTPEVRAINGAAKARS